MYDALTMPPTPLSSETIVISFLCGSLALSFLLAALGAIFKVYRPSVPVVQRLRKFLAKGAPGSETTGQQQAVERTAVELVDNGFAGRESLVRGMLSMYHDLGCVSVGECPEANDSRVAHPMPVA